jgi:hypothetical protein
MVDDLRAALPPGVTEGHLSAALESLADAGRVTVNADRDPRNPKVTRDGRVPVAGYSITGAYLRDTSKPLKPEELHKALSDAGWRPGGAK